MRLTNLLAAFVLVLLSLNGCSKLQKEFPPPDVDLGVAVWRNNLEESYGYFTPYFYEGRPSSRIPSTEVFTQKTILMKLEDFNKLEAYIELIQREAAKRCE